MTSNQYALVVRGTAFTSRTPTEVAALRDHLFCVADDGLIARIVAPSEPDFVRLATGAVTLADGQFLLPGFIDLHVHAPQWAQAGTALDAPLADWLQTYTFPLEARFADLGLARRVYADVVDNLLANGTTTALYFATRHLEASVELARICAERGQRGLVGKVVMDDPATTPEFYRDIDATTAVAETVAFIEAVRGLPQPAQGVHPVVMPRFVPSCTDAALSGLGRVARDLGVRVHSHASESDWEHDFVLSRFGRTDAEVLAGFGLLTPDSVFAHCTHLTDSDVNLFARTGAAIAHCPISNAYFAGAVLPLRRFREAGVTIGLGSDISGGFSPSLYANIAQAQISSRMLADGVDVRLPAAQRGVPAARITLNEAFYAATAAGGAALDLPIGRLEVGYAFDAQLVDTRATAARLPELDQPTLERRFEQLILLARPENIRRVWVAGREVINKFNEGR